MFDGVDWSHASADEIDRGFDCFGGLQSTAAAQLCDLIRAADSAEVWMGDVARSSSEWVLVRLGVRFATARRLLAVARRLGDLPQLSVRFACGDLSLDQVEAM